jgi:hypothetical protein
LFPAGSEVGSRIQKYTPIRGKSTKPGKRKGKKKDEDQMLDAFREMATLTR